MLETGHLNIETADDGYTYIHHDRVRYVASHYERLRNDDIFCARVDSRALIIVTMRKDIIIATTISAYNAQHQVFDVRLEGTPCMPMLRVLGTDRVIPVPDHVDLSDINSYVVSATMQVIHRSCIATIQ